MNDEQKNQKDDHSEDSFHDYNPNQAYNYERAHAKQEYDSDGHPIPPKRPKANNLARIGFAASLITPFLCCCNPYSAILTSIMGIALAICSRFFYNEQGKFHPIAVASIIISAIMLVLIIGSIMITYVFVPYLMETSPEFKQYYEQMYQLLDDFTTNTQ